MTLRSEHIPDDELLLHADGEMAVREAARVRRHLAGCEPCRARLAVLNGVLSESASDYRAAQPRMDASGPRALLRARMQEEIAVREPANPAHRWHSSLLRGLAFVCALMLLAVTGIQVVRRAQEARPVSVAHSGSQVGMLPDPGMTPGSTRRVTLAEVCAVDRDEVVREVPAPLQQKVFQEYGIKDQPARNFEVDYLITPGLGGSDDVRNLWPQAHAEPVWNSYVKDQLEDHLHHMVCHGELNLKDAQRELASNWISAYKKYFHTDRPLASSELSQL